MRVLNQKGPLQGQSMETGAWPLATATQKTRKLVIVCPNWNMRVVVALQTCITDQLGEEWIG